MTVKKICPSCKQKRDKWAIDYCACERFNEYQECHPLCSSVVREQP